MSIGVGYIYVVTIPREFSLIFPFYVGCRAATCISVPESLVVVVVSPAHPVIMKV